MNQLLRRASYLLISFMAVTSLSLQANEQAKPWQLKTQRGELISLAQYKNKPVILHFWATWCPYCKKLQPTLVELQKKYQAQGVELISISFNEDEGALPQDEINSRGYSFLTAVMGEEVAKLYDVSGTPTTFFINRQNEIIFKTSSSNKADPRLDLALKEITKI
ncbi:alkyl hydroperoxide reductase/ Thiol specific antioxidant/ Mal allergen [Colwellia psychrerythraea]|uniref:Alkyl hydroperoxide reductase/ Thiol specific antioxidant/ Mal allergen n=2 Tax=Colwellia psychrerythraea TaxID=28229 RepID=A0A099L3D7_COLPS|nr:alkyl hydroperoxide reductase/ Thiol specific antioxidant/ Mal allergen [Colwellia psychrerythraea]